MRAKQNGLHNSHSINELQGVADCNIVLEVMLGATVYVLEVMKSSFSFAWRVSASPAFSLLHIPPLLKCSVEANTAIQYCNNSNSCDYTERKWD